MPIARLRLASLLLAAGTLCACEVGPNYHRPAAPTPQVYKEVAGWSPATPSDAADRKDWWTMFNDPILNGLEERVEKSNFTLAADFAAYQQAHAMVAEARAALWPTLSGTGEAQVGKTAAGSTTSVSSSGGSTGVTTSHSTTYTGYTLGLGATWEPDIWGSVRRQIENAKGTAQSSYATYVNARLSSEMSWRPTTSPCASSTRRSVSMTTR